MGKRVRIFRCIRSSRSRSSAYTHINSKCPWGVQEQLSLILFCSSARQLLLPGDLYFPPHSSSAAPSSEAWGPAGSAEQYPWCVRFVSHSKRSGRLLVLVLILILVDGVFSARSLLVVQPSLALLLLLFIPFAHKAYSNDGFQQNAMFNVLYRRIKFSS